MACFVPQLGPGSQIVEAHSWAGHPRAARRKLSLRAACMPPGRSSPAAGGRHSQIKGAVERPGQGRELTRQALIVIVVRPAGQEKLRSAGAGSTGAGARRLRRRPAMPCSGSGCTRGLAASSCVKGSQLSALSLGANVHCTANDRRCSGPAGGASRPGRRKSASHASSPWQMHGPCGRERRLWRQDLRMGPFCC